MTLTPTLRVLTIALILGCSLPSLATPVMDMRAEDLLPMATEFKKSLNLTPNQQILWNQVENKSCAILRERVSRRERMQAAGKSALEQPGVELRDLVGPVDAEAATSLAEEKQLRAMWLEVNDALDENQRKQVAALIVEQLMRVPAPDHGGGERARPSEGAAPHKGMGGRRGGGSGGNGGGMGMPGA